MSRDLLRGVGLYIVGAGEAHPPWTAGHQKGQAGTPEHKPGCSPQEEGLQGSLTSGLPADQIRPRQTIEDSRP